MVVQKENFAQPIPLKGSAQTNGREVSLQKNL